MSREHQSLLHNNDKRKQQSREMPSPSDLEEPLLNTPDIKVYKKRWFMLFLFCMTTMLNGSMFMGLSPVVDIVAPYYNVSPVNIEWLSNMFMVVYLFVAMPSAYLMTKYSVRAILVVASGCAAAAATMQYAGYQQKSYMFVLMGQFFAAVAYGNIIQVPGKLSAVWFAPKERGISTSIGIFMNILGVALGFVQPTHMIPPTKDFNQIKHGLRMFFVSKLVLSVVIFGLTMAFFRERPPTPSSHAQLDGIDEPSFTQSLKLLCKDKNFVLMAQAYGIYYGLYVGVSVIVSSIIFWKFEHVDSAITGKIGWMGFMCNIAAAISCYVIGVYLDRTSRYKCISVFLNLGALTLWLVFIMLVTQTNNLTSVFVTYIIFGTVGIPYFASGVEQAAEMTSPVPEGTSSTVILLLGNLYGFTFILGFGELVVRNYHMITMYIILGLYGLSSFFLCLSKTELKREMAENAWINEELPHNTSVNKRHSYGTGNNNDEKRTYVVFANENIPPKAPNV